jgi:hypothetical protein
MNPRASKRFVVAVLLLHVALGAVLAVHHEAWRDEGETWLFARDAAPGEFWGRLGYRGTPALWEVTLMPFARTGFPFQTAAVVHQIVAAAAALVLLRFAPFSRLIKVLLLFSYLLGYEYLAITRNYAPLVLLLFVLAWLDRDERDRPIAWGITLGLLANTSVHGLFMASAIGAGCLAEKVRNRQLGGRVAVGHAIAVGFGLLSVAQLWPPVDGAHSGLFYTTEWRAFRWSISQSLFPGLKISSLHWVAIPVFVLLLAAIARHRRALLTFLLGWAGLLYLLIFKVAGGARHFGLVFLLLVWALWISEDGSSDRIRTAALRSLTVVLGIGVLTAAHYWVVEIRHPFSGAKEMAAYLENEGHVTRQIAMHLPATGSAILAYLTEPRSFWFPALAAEGSYMKWDHGYEAADRIGYGYVAMMTRRQVPDALLLLNEPLDDPSRYGFTLEFATSSDVFEKTDEIFYLYRPLPTGISLEDAAVNPDSQG